MTILRRFIPGLAFLICCTAGNVSGQTYDENYLDGVVYTYVQDTHDLTHYEEFSAFDPLVINYGIDSISDPFRESEKDTLLNTYRVEFSEINQTTQLIEALEDLPFIGYAEKMPLYESVAFTPDDINDEQWSLDKINAEEAWDITKGSPEVTISVVDNGVRRDHEDLDGNIWENPDPNTVTGGGVYINDYNGYDVADNNNDPDPPEDLEEGSAFNHGTHVAGIASAVTNNGKGIASIGYQASIIAVKATPDDSDGRAITHAYEGIDYSRAAEADIINMSFGGDSPSITGEQVIREAHQEDIVLVAAAGNQDTSAKSYPAGFDEVISVGATNSSDEKAFFSNYGEHVDLMAPGRDIYSTLAETENSYGPQSGTSMSSPIVAGLASLVLAENPGISNEGVRDYLKNGADDLDPPKDNEGKMGAGRINALQTLELSTGGLSFAPSGNFLMDVYPNPFNNELTISVQAGSPEEFEVLLFNQSGKEVFRNNVQSFNGKATISLEELEGEELYLLQLRDKKGALLSTENLFKKP